jgi:hypothetical protein
MKVFAIGRLVKPLTPELRQHFRPIEVPATVRLYLDGKIEQFWFQDDVGPVFLMDTAAVEEAKAAIDALPLTADGFVEYEYLPVGPLKPLGLLLQVK